MVKEFVGNTFGKSLLNCYAYRHIGPAPGTMVGSGIGFHSRFFLVRIYYVPSTHYNAKLVLYLRFWCLLFLCNLKSLPMAHSNKTSLDHRWLAMFRTSASTSLPLVLVYLLSNMPCQ
ncbi:hypothetical protein TNCV_4159091 [Trichonephila clavipes]|nr:hypothetical protein TNCV_4159091 [Trichonephila clavipes]